MYAESHWYPLGTSIKSLRSGGCWVIAPEVETELVCQCHHDIGVKGDTIAGEVEMPPMLMRLRSRCLNQRQGTTGCWRSAIVSATVIRPVLNVFTCGSGGVHLTFAESSAVRARL
jgi:hypothetical protein